MIDIMSKIATAVNTHQEQPCNKTHRAHLSPQQNKGVSKAFAKSKKTS